MGICVNANVYFEIHLSKCKSPSLHRKPHKALYIVNQVKCFRKVKNPWATLNVFSKLSLQDQHSVFPVLSQLWPCVHFLCLSLLHAGQKRRGNHVTSLRGCLREAFPKCFITFTCHGSKSQWMSVSTSTVYRICIQQTFCFLSFCYFYYTDQLALSCKYETCNTYIPYYLITWLNH